MFRSYRRSEPEISLSALVDVLFILIVFVVLAANFDRARAIEVSLPAGGQLTSHDADAAILQVTASGAMRLQDAPVQATELEDRLRALRAQKSSLILAAEGDVSMTRAASLLSTAQRAGFVDVAIATSDPSSSTTGRAPASTPGSAPGSTTGPTPASGQQSGDMP